MKSEVDPQINISWDIHQAKSKLEGRQRPFDMTKVIDLNINLDQFSEEDWYYSAHYDVLFVKEGSKLYSWIALQTG